MSDRRAPFVQLPCAVIDEIMPTLRDTEFRILIVVFRQTIGRRQADGSTKERDWLSHSQLRARTGRAGEAVSSAVDALVQRGLLYVYDRDGKALATPQERRRFRGRFYYALGPIFNDLIWRSLKTQVGKSKITTEALMPIYSPFRFSDDTTSRSSSGKSTSSENRVIEAKMAIRRRLDSIDRQAL